MRHCNKQVLAVGVWGACALATAIVAHAQISLQTAVDLSLKNSPRVHAAQADVDRAQAAWQEARDAYIPVITTLTGYGQATGAPLNVPVIFSISAQSLVFSYQQRDNVRAAEQARESAQHTLQFEQTSVMQDATNTYVALDNAQRRKGVMRQESQLAERLLTVTSERIDAGVDPKVELPKSHRTALQIRLSSLQLDDEVAVNTRHLATLTGLPLTAIQTDSRSIPEFAPLRQSTVDTVTDDAGIAALVATAKSKEYLAFADKRYLLRPQITLASNYSRVATGLSSYAAYYPRYAGTPEHPNSENALSFGLQFTIPLLDMAHRAKARQDAAEARRAFADVELQRGIYREGRAKLQNSALELQLRAELAQAEQEIAEDQFQTLQLQLKAAAGSVSGPQSNPKDALNAELLERQRYYDLLLARLQLQQTQLNLLQQDGGLSTWVQNPAGAVPATGQVLPLGTTVPSVPGVVPQGTSSTLPNVPAPQAPH